jgi:Zn-dependent peptidase ImmA (M78 family)
MNALNILESICDAEDITLISKPFTSRLNGLAMRDKDGGKAIGYKAGMSDWSTASVVAHELGHHLLGHLELKGYSAHNEERGGNWVNERGEREAEIFAAVFTAMMVFIKYSQGDTPGRSRTRKSRRIYRLQKGGVV